MNDLVPTIALSYSRLSTFEQCPYKFKSQYIDKDYPDDSNNPAFVKGSQIHGQLEDYIVWLNSDQSGEQPVLGSIAQNAKAMIDDLHKASEGNIFPEKQIAVDQNWNKCDWFDKPHVVKYRAIIDTLVFLGPILLIIDWKTGKFRAYEASDTSQLRLTAAILFNLYPKVEKIVTSYMFVEHQRTVKLEFTRDDIGELMAPFDHAHYVVNSEQDFDFKKNRFCNWCLSKTCPIRKK